MSKRSFDLSPSFLRGHTPGPFDLTEDVTFEKIAICNIVFFANLKGFGPILYIPMRSSTKDYLIEN